MEYGIYAHVPKQVEWINDAINSANLKTTYRSAGSLFDQSVKCTTEEELSKMTNDNDVS